MRMGVAGRRWRSSPRQTGCAAGSVRCWSLAAKTLFILPPPWHGAFRPIASSGFDRLDMPMWFGRSIKRSGVKRLPPFGRTSDRTWMTVTPDVFSWLPRSAARLGFWFDHHRYVAAPVLPMCVSMLPASIGRASGKVDWRGTQILAAGSASRTTG